MEEELLKVIFYELVEVLKLNYEYMEWSGNLVYPYITGEHYTNSYNDEIDRLDGEMLLEIWNKGDELNLVKIHDKIQEHFRNYTKIQNNMGFSITYKNKSSARTGLMNIKKIQIYLETKVWKGE